MNEFEKVSSSSLSDYLKCPALFYYRQYLKLRLLKKSLPLAFGSALHKGLEEYEKNGADPIAEFEKAFIFEDILWEKSGVELDDDQAEDKYQEEVENGIRLLEHFIIERENGILSNYEVMHTEERFLTNLKPIKERKSKVKFLSGIVDVRTTDEWIYDYKTSSKKYKQEVIDDPEKTIQPTVYYLWYYLTFGKLPTGFKYIVFMKTRKSNPIEVLTTKRTIKDLLQLYNTINYVKTKVDKKIFNRTHGKSAFCDCYKLEAYFNSLREIKYDRSNSKREMVFPFTIG